MFGICNWGRIGVNVVHCIAGEFPRDVLESVLKVIILDPFSVGVDGSKILIRILFLARKFLLIF